MQICIVPYMWVSYCFTLFFIVHVLHAYFQGFFQPIIVIGFKETVCLLWFKAAKQFLNYMLRKNDVLLGLKTKNK